MNWKKTKKKNTKKKKKKKQQEKQKVEQFDCDFETLFNILVLNADKLRFVLSKFPPLSYNLELKGGPCFWRSWDSLK